MLQRLLLVIQGLVLLSVCLDLVQQLLLVHLLLLAFAHLILLLQDISFQGRISAYLSNDILSLLVMLLVLALFGPTFFLLSLSLVLWFLHPMVATYPHFSFLSNERTVPLSTHNLCDHIIWF